MLYASQLIGQAVVAPGGARLGRVRDLVLRLPDGAARAAGEQWPRLAGIIAEAGRRAPGWWVPGADLARLTSGAVALARPPAERGPHARGEGELLVRANLWDRRVIDTAAHQVRRINDVALGAPAELDQTAPDRDGYAPGELALLGADIGATGLVRRLGLYPVLAGLAGRWLGPHLLPWPAMEVVAVGLLGADVRHVDLNRLHPAELAGLTQGVSMREAAELIAALDDPLAADVMEELPADRQIDIVEFLPDTRAADILEEMAPDDASDLLGDLPGPRSRALLAEMDPDAGSAVRRLLQYPDNTAGGLMTTRFVSVPQDLTVAGVLARLREAPEAARANMIYYVYVTAAEGDDRLVGVLTLRDLLLAAPDTPLDAIMEHDLLFTAPDTDAGDVARRMAEYNLLGLPVLDAKGRILGIVTVDDALDVLLPADWQRRLPRVFS